MTDRKPEPMSAQRGEQPSRDTALLDELEPETVEDLDVDDDAADVRGGTTFNCPTSH